LNYLGNLLLWEGDWERADHYLNQSLAVAQEIHDRLLQEGAHALLAELEILEGRPEKAVQRLEPWVADDADVLLLPTLAWAHLTMDDEESVQRAEQVTGQALERAQQQPGLLVGALRIHAMVLMRMGQLEEAERTLKQALDVAKSLTYPYEEARILFQIGSLSGQKHDADGESTSYKEALTIFQRLGARKDIERTEQALTAASE
jgi:tetratricopeptide (TPR) repeat protein